MKIQTIENNIPEFIFDSKNNILNLKLMSAVEHIKHHTLEKKRAKDGKFSI